MFQWQSDKNKLQSFSSNEFNAKRNSWISHTHAQRTHIHTSCIIYSQATANTAQYLQSLGTTHFLSCIVVLAPIQNGKKNFDCHCRLCDDNSESFSHSHELFAVFCCWCCSLPPFCHTPLNISINIAVVVFSSFSWNFPYHICADVNGDCIEWIGHFMAPFSLS